MIDELLTSALLFAIGYLGKTFVDRYRGYRHKRDLRKHLETLRFRQEMMAVLAHEDKTSMPVGPVSNPMARQDMDGANPETSELKEWCEALETEEIARLQELYQWVGKEDREWRGSSNT